MLGINNYLPFIRSDPGGHDGPPLLSLPPARRSLTEGSSQIPGTNDSTLRQLKPPPSQPRRRTCQPTTSPPGDLSEPLSI